MKEKNQVLEREMFQMIFLEGLFNRPLMIIKIVKEPFSVQFLFDFCIKMPQTEFSYLKLCLIEQFRSRNTINQGRKIH